MFVQRVEAKLDAVGILEYQQESDRRFDDVGMGDTKFIEAPCPSLNIRSPVQHDREEVEARDTSCCLAVLAQREREVAFRSVRDASDDAVVVVSKLRERFQIEDPFVPCTASHEVRNRDLDVVNAENLTSTHHTSV